MPLTNNIKQKAQQFWQAVQEDAPALANRMEVVLANINLARQNDGLPPFTMLQLVWEMLAIQATQGEASTKMNEIAAQKEEEKRAAIEEAIQRLKEAL